MKTLIAILAAVLLIGVASTAYADCGTEGTASVSATISKLERICVYVDGSDYSTVNLIYNGELSGDITSTTTLDFELDLVVYTDTTTELVIIPATGTFTGTLSLTPEDIPIDHSGFQSFGGLGWFPRVNNLTDGVQVETFYGPTTGPITDNIEFFYTVWGTTDPLVSAQADEYEEVFYFVARAFTPYP